MSRRRWPEVTAGTAALRAMAERGSLAIALAFYVLVVGVLAALWRAAIDSNGGVLAGYTTVAITWYAAMAEAVIVCLNQRMIREIGDDIGSGAVAVELLRPAPVLGVRVAGALGRALPRWRAGPGAGPGAGGRRRGRLELRRRRFQLRRRRRRGRRGAARARGGGGGAGRGAGRARGRRSRRFR